jgi:2-methylcitrate dehydratase PrpD
MSALVTGGLNMEFQTTYQVESYILNTKWEDLPKHIQDRAIVCGIDLLMALIVGSQGRQFQAGVKLADTLGLSGSISVPGTHGKYNLLGAAMAMSHASNSFDIDDGHNMIKGHPGTSFVAGITAAATEKGATYREYLTTLITAYETTIRWALAMQHHYGFLHSTGAYGAYGTAAGIGRLYGLDKEMLNNALSIADFHAPMTPVMRSVEYPSMNKDGVPFGALAGTMAVLETLAGSTGYGNLLELPEYQHLVATIGKEFEVLRLYFKPYTCCRWSHQPIKAIIDLMAEHNFTHKDVESVTVNTFDSAARLSKIVPKRADEAQYNIAWPVASALVFGDVGFLQVTEEALENEDVLATMKKLTFQVDPELDSQFPEKRLASVEIALSDGRKLKSSVYAAPGEHTDQIDLDWITEKFMRITKPMLSETDQAKLLKVLTKDLDQPVSEIIQMINGMLGVPLQ